MWHWDPAFIHWLQKPDPAEWLGAIFTGTAASFGVRAYGMQVRDRRERTSADRRRQAERVWVTEPTPTEWRRNDGVDIFSSVVVHNASDLPVDYVSVVMTARLYERQEPRPNLGIGISDGFEQSPMLDDREPPGWDPTSLRWRRYNVGRMAPNRETKPITVYIPVDDIGHDDEGQEWLWTVRLEFVDAVGRKWMRGGRGRLGLFEIQRTVPQSRWRRLRHRLAT